MNWLLRKLMLIPHVHRASTIIVGKRGQFAIRSFMIRFAR
jgi:hypothetical protein